ncbi:ABC transporter ATP-binding protein [Palleronia sediminis]|uniref:ABC transporter ATP-binding protein n=1 Tax=Palleronia sediminis TaxID=2547833 RepID=A0A4R6A4V2_9RHOB|nr:ABC transporter ATP-binding protein [Palleronia sediminis]TDL77694.1 ABC transporter ATP-binding protein [Palleronia sediminis]
MDEILRTEGLSRHFAVGARRLTALDDVSLRLGAGRILGVVGESGSGKTTLARLVMALDRPSAGRVLIAGREVSAMPPAVLRRARTDFQMVFQDPYGSLDPRQRVARIVAEPLHLLPDPPRGAARRALLAATLAEVGLEPDALDRFPHQFSGGQRQRIAIARAIVTRPRLLVADEATSALDVTVQRRILDLLLGLRAKHGIAVLFISHDIGVVDEICDEIAVMRAGRIVETGPARDVLDAPRAPYTRALVAAAPRLDTVARRAAQAVRPSGSGRP